jgi:hypothetical protein
MSSRRKKLIPNYPFKVLYSMDIIVDAFNPNNKYKERISLTKSQHEKILEKEIYIDQIKSMRYIQAQMARESEKRFKNGIFITPPNNTSQPDTAEY